MAEASGGKPDIPPSKEGDAGGDSDHPDDSSTEPLEAGELVDSSVADGESSEDETDSTVGEIAKHDLRVRRLTLTYFITSEIHTESPYHIKGLHQKVNAVIGVGSTG